MALSGTTLTVTTLSTAGLLTNNTSGQISSVTGSSLAALLGGAPVFSGLTLSSLVSVMLKTNSSGVVVAAVAGTDYQAALTAGAGISLAGNVASIAASPTLSGSVTLSSLATGILKVTAGVVSVATANTDYQTALTAGTNQTVGTGTLPAVTSGGYLVALGNAAGRVVTTGSYGIYLGANSTASAAGVSSEIVIGADATAANVTGKGANSAFIRSIAGMFGGQYVPAVASGVVTPLNNANGSYISCLNGMLHQYVEALATGSLAANGWATTTWTFPVSFPTRCVGVMFYNCDTAAGGALGMSFYARSVTVSSAVAVYSNFWSSTSTYRLCGMAWGY